MGWYETPDTLPGTKRCYQIEIPDNPEIIASVIGQLQELANPKTWSYIGDVTPDEIAEAMRDMVGEMTESECEMPVPEVGYQTRITLWHRWAQIQTGNALQTVIDATNMHNHYVRQNTAAIGDETYQECWLSEGLWQIRVLYFRAVVNGKVSFIFQHQPSLAQVTPISLQDLSGATQANSVLTASFTITQAGHYKMFTNVGAGGASTGGFFCPIIHTELWRDD